MRTRARERRGWVNNIHRVHTLCCVMSLFQGLAEHASQVCLVYTIETLSVK